MLSDLKTALWKEWREQILQYGSFARWLINMAVLVGVLNSIADAIAGERERHTLETLLASRLPDAAILSGKIAVPVLQSWLVMLIAAVLALVTVNLTRGKGELIMYPTAVIFGILALPVLAGLLIAGIGTLVSSHATTVRQAYQRMVIPLFVVVLVPSLGISLLPSDTLAVLYSPEFAQNNLGGVLLSLALTLLGLDAIVIFLAFRHFQRSRLIVD